MSLGRTPWHVSRRRFLGVAASGAFAGVVGVPQLATAAGAAPGDGDEFDQLRSGWCAVLTGGSIDTSAPVYAAALDRLDTAAAAAQAKLDRSAGAQVVFTDLPLTASANVSTSATRLLAIATAVSTPGTELAGDPAATADVVAGLGALTRLVYRPAQAEFGNWWDWEIGTAQAVTNTCALMFSQLDADLISTVCATIDHFVPSPLRMINQTIVSTGGNRTDLCQVVAIRGILGRSADHLGTARDGLSDVFGYVRTGDGYYLDGSFVQHTRVAYTGTYGIVLLAGLSKLIALLSGTTWEVTDPHRSVVFDAIAGTYAPMIYDGQMLDFVRGRAISRATETDHADGHTAVDHILRLAGGAPAAQAAQWRGLCKGWLERDAGSTDFSAATVQRIAAYSALLADDSVTGTPEPVVHQQFPCMDRVVHRGAGWAFAVSLSSERISAYEVMNTENLRGYHTGDGMTYLYGTDPAHYSDNFWATVDPDRLPGITVDTTPLPDSAGSPPSGPLPPTSWVGGAMLRPRRTEPASAGAAGMQLAPIDSPLRAVKSWFCAPDRIVALGAGITATGSRRIETVIDNRNLHTADAPVFTVDGAEQQAAPGWSDTFDGASWAHLDGVGGYLLPGTAALTALQEDRTGRWHDVNGGGSTAAITRRYHTIYLDHGVDPDAASYAYVLLPGRTAGETAAAAAASDLQIIANSAAVQAIRLPAARLTMANFWSPGTAAGITVNAPCSVVMGEAAGTVTVAVSDPSRAATSLTVTVPARDITGHDGDPQVSVASTRPWARLTVDVAGALGDTRSIRLLRRPGR